MIPFFRKIRKKMADDKKPLKYMRYAIGEIILVVIGILIALQVNNWNEQRKERNFELKMLKEIRYELIKDTIYFNALLKLRVRRLGATVDTINSFLKNGKTENDSILKYWGELGLGYRYVYHKGAFESLKSVGLDKISNDSIRAELASLYDFDLPRTDELIEFSKSKSKTTLERVVPKLIEHQLIETPEGYIKTIKSRDSLLYQNSDFIEILIAKKEEVSNSELRFISILYKCSQLLRMLDKELKIAYPSQDIPADKYGN
jgi:hypothetical protein